MPILAFAFLLAPILWALPLAGLPVLLHMLFRRKSPIISFSTLRFIRTSIQQTAARRRIQKWLLLACRILLLALLIWAMSQPVRKIAAAWTGSGQNTIAAIVVDTSYSMLLKQQELTQLEKAGDIINDLLREPLKDAKVAIFRSQPAPSENPEQLRKVSEIQAQWTALRPQPAPHPLAERISAALSLLQRQPADQKWLVILTDLQSREFPAPLPAVEPGTRIVFFDLHPDNPSSHGITSIQVKPEQPIPGVGADAYVEVTGHAGDAPFADLKFTNLDGTELSSFSNLQANFETTGRTRIRVPLPKGVPFERWLLATAKLQKDDDLMWDNTRSQLIELPPKQTVTFIDAPTQPNASRFIRFALDPYQDPKRAWPLELKSATSLTGSEQVLVWPLTQWPSDADLSRLHNFVQAGNTAILLLQPGLEQSFDSLTPAQKSALSALLPASLAGSSAGGGSAGSGAFRPVPPAKPDPILEDITDPSARLDQCIIRRFVPFSAPTDPAVSTLLYLSPRDSDSRAQPFGLFYRRIVGAGLVYTFSTLPDNRYVNPPTHPLFPILLIKSSLRSATQRDAQNVELGQPLTLAGSRFDGIPALELSGPGDIRERIEPQSGQFTFTRTIEPGLYYWRKPGDTQILAIANVQLPATEADLIYRPAETIAGNQAENCVIVRSFAELRSHMAALDAGEPQWTLPIMIVLMLMCVEAILGSLAHLWKGQGIGAFVPMLRGAGTTE
jgi:hypothetical protein